MSRESPSFPPGLHHAYWFATFNALSYQIILSSPMVLYARSLGASATVLGIIAGMMPLLVIFQIPAASHIERVGYKRFVFAGWGTRVTFIFFMALVPLTGRFLTLDTQLALLLFLLFGFNLSRGISSTAWLPWITALVPEAIRGKYLARDAVCVHLASCLTFALAALGLGKAPQAWQFALLFGFSAINGAISLSFLKQIPDVTPPPPEAKARGAVPWGAILGHAPFRKALAMIMCWSAAYGGVSTFTVAYLKTEAGLSEGLILLLTATAFLGGLAGLLYFGSRTDRLGSKPVVAFSLGIWLLIMAGWFALAAGVLPLTTGRVLAVELFMGFAYALVTMNNTRLVMLLAPVMGRNHFFALYSVAANLTLGVAPVVWGLLIDLVGPRKVAWARVEWNRFSAFFAAVLVVFALALVFCRRLEEPKARDVDELIRELLKSPQRLWLRLWPRG